MQSDQLQALIAKATEDAKIDSLQLSKEFIRFPATLLYWSIQTQAALKEVKRCELALDSVEASVAQVVRAAGKITEAGVKEKVLISAGRKKAQADLDEAEVAYKTLRGIENAIGKLEFMLTGLAKMKEREERISMQHTGR